VDRKDASVDSEAASRVLPYSAVVGQEEVRRALEIAYVAPRIGGVLLSGERGTGKSTVVRAFSLMVRQELPVTLPIHATEDRVVGGWNIAAALRGEPEWEEGLLHDVGKERRNKIFYIDEVNLLDDHLVNIILDVTATGILEVQREGHAQRDALDFTLVGTMNPEEGGLRPQLLDRFGLMVQVRTEVEDRAKVLSRVLNFDRALTQRQHDEPSNFLEQMAAADVTRRDWLNTVRDERIARLDKIPDPILGLCVELAAELGVDGHRGERVLALAAQACAALDKEADRIEARHLRAVAAMALQHRQKGMAERTAGLWSAHHEEALERILG
jgi:magnesium chelatase subunit I